MFPHPGWLCPLASRDSLSCQCPIQPNAEASHHHRQRVPLFFPGNLVRVLPGKVDAVVDRSTWEQPRVFTEIQRLGGVDPEEMARRAAAAMGG